MWLGMFWTRLRSGWSVFSKEEQVVATIIEIANVGESLRAKIVVLGKYHDRRC